MKLKEPDDYILNGVGCQQRQENAGSCTSSFNHQTKKPLIALILSNSRGKQRMTTFKAVFSKPFSAVAFTPQAVKQFLDAHANNK